MNQSKKSTIGIIPIIILGLIKAVLFFLGVYICFAFYNGFEWSTEISRTYVFLLIRFIVITILAIPSLLIIPFKFGTCILYYGKFAAALGFVIGCLEGYSIDPKAFEE